MLAKLILTRTYPERKIFKIALKGKKIYSVKNYLMSTREHSKDNLPIVFRFS